MPINRSSTADMKKHTDFEVIKYYRKLYERNYYYEDVYLVITFTALAIAALTSWYDYDKGFQNAKTVTTIGVSLFFIVYGLSMVWNMTYNKNLLFYGQSKDEQIWVRTSTKKYTPVYEMEITFLRGNNKKTIKEKIPFGNIFTESGSIAVKHFQSWLQSLRKDE
ncbi:hypothetical protein CANCADRAFT_2679 [Tortispora caseinolytica NRRL Y-17796]|uniref:Signal peptidase complex subunit 2 n=1 Tax=Tortispora caseinolytica NRRL Y-17796 TaxID=767744 RepID=A0A1E4TGT1_9ASCO|nr:hypothetical protein CANCADRAFT_2679 [Tortispora caseinolytica NRRL Y-17796]